MAVPRTAAGDLTGPSVSLGWGEWGVRTLAPGAAVVVIVDVLSFSTAVCVAVSRGAAVLPYPLADGAARFAAEHDAVLAVHRDEQSPDRPFSLSPVSMQGASPGQRIVLPSPNGAALSLTAAESGAEVVAGCLRNAAAVATHAAAARGPVAVIAAGERWPDGSLRPALEDYLGAGAVLAALGAERSPDAEVAVGAFRAAADVAGAITRSISGRELIDRAAAGDVALAVDVNADAIVPLLRDGAYVAG